MVVLLCRRCGMPPPSIRIRLYMLLEVLDVATDDVLLAAIMYDEAATGDKRRWWNEPKYMCSFLLVLSCTASFLFCATARFEQLRVYRQNDDTRRLIATATASSRRLQVLPKASSPATVAESADLALIAQMGSEGTDDADDTSEGPCYDKLRELRADVWAKRAQRYSLLLEDFPMMFFNGYYSFLAPEASRSSHAAIVALVFSSVSIVYKVWKTASLARTKLHVLELESKIDSFLKERGVGAGRRHSLVLAEEKERTEFYATLLGDEILNQDFNDWGTTHLTTALHRCELIREGQYTIKDMRAWHAAGKAFVTKELLPSVVAVSEQHKPSWPTETRDALTANAGGESGTAFEQFIAELQLWQPTERRKSDIDAVAHSMMSERSEEENKAAGFSGGGDVASDSPMISRRTASAKITPTIGVAGLEGVSSRSTSESTDSESAVVDSAFNDGAKSEPKPKVRRHTTGGPTGGANCGGLRLLTKPTSFRDAAALGRLVVAALQDAEGTESAGIRALKERLVATMALKKKQKKKWRSELRTKHLQRLALAHVLSERYAALGGLEEQLLTTAGREGLLSKTTLLRVMFYLDSLEAETLVTVWGWDAERSWGVQLHWACS